MSYGKSNKRIPPNYLIRWPLDKIESINPTGSYWEEPEFLQTSSPPSLPPYPTPTSMWTWTPSCLVRSRLGNRGFWKGSTNPLIVSLDTQNPRSLWVPMVPMQYNLNNISGAPFSGSIIIWDTKKLRDASPKVLETNSELITVIGWPMPACWIFRREKGAKCRYNIKKQFPCICGRISRFQSLGRNKKTWTLNQVR